MTSRAKTALLIAGLVALTFGALTVLSGGRALFGGASARAAVGDAVPFVLWFNFIAGFAYVMAGVGLILRRAWSVWLSAAILAVTLLVLAAFGLHVLQGGAYETRTVGAMLLRTGFWAGILILAIPTLRLSRRG